jgi:hypothetical protein
MVAVGTLQNSCSGPSSHRQIVGPSQLPPREYPTEKGSGGSWGMAEQDDMRVGMRLC